MTVLRTCWAIALANSLLTVPSTVSGGGVDAPLVEAVRHLDRLSINDLLSQGVDVNASGSDGTTALHWAAHHGDLETVARLVEAGADVALANRYGVALIWLASEGGHAAIVELLLRAGVDPNAGRGDSGEMVLLIAARAGHIDVLQRLISYDADVNRKDRVREPSALMWAAAEGHRAAVRLLAEAGAGLDAQSSTGMTPFMFAIRSGNIGTVRRCWSMVRTSRRRARMARRCWCWRFSTHTGSSRSSCWNREPIPTVMTRCTAARCRR